MAKSTPAVVSRNAKAQIKTRFLLHEFLSKDSPEAAPHTSVKVFVNQSVVPYLDRFDALFAETKYQVKDWRNLITVRVEVYNGITQTSGE